MGPEFFKAYSFFL